MTYQCPARGWLDDNGHHLAGLWVMCEHPERPPDPEAVSFPNDCEKCAIAHEAAQRLIEKGGAGWSPLKVRHQWLPGTIPD